MAIRTHHAERPRHPTIAALSPFPGESMTDYARRIDLFRTRSHARARQLERFVIACAGLALILAGIVLHFYHVANY